MAVQVRVQGSIGVCGEERHPSAANCAVKLPAPDRARPTMVLTVARDQFQRVFTDEVLRSAGFTVLTLTPLAARDLIDNGGGVDFPVVVFSDTVLPEEMSELGTELRRRSPDSKVLLLRGPDSVLIHKALYDSLLEALDGPVALIEEVRHLAGIAPVPAAPQRISATPAAKTA